MAGIKYSVGLDDKMTPVLNSVTTALNLVISNMERMQSVSSKAIDVSALQSARGHIANAEIEVNKIRDEIEKANNSQNKFTNSVNGTANAFSMLKGMMGFSVISKVINMVVGSIDSAINRFDTLNNYPKVMSNLGIGTEQAQASINRLSDGLSGLPTTLNSAVLSVQRLTSVNDNIGASTEMFLALNNAILAGGASTDIQTTAIEQLSQAYSKGKPDMMEWRSLQTAMPAQLNQIAKAMGMTTNDLGEGLRKGTISMNDFMKTIVKLNTEGISGFASFEEQAKNATGGIGTQIINMGSAITRGVTSIIEKINEGLASIGMGSVSDGIQSFGKTMENVLKDFGDRIKQIIVLLSPVINLVKNIADLIINNWPIIEPIFLGIITALGTYLMYLGLVRTAEMIGTVIKVAMCLASYAYAAATHSVASATAQATAAQYGFNTALLSCPITWIILAVIALIAIISAVIVAVNKAQGKTVSAIGVVVGVISVLVAFIYNVFIVRIWNTIAAFINFFANVFNNPVTAVKMLFYNLALDVINYISMMSKAIENIINKIPGVQVNITAGLDNFKNKIEKAAQKVKDESEWVEVAKTLEYKQFDEAYNWGYGKGIAAEESLKNIMNGLDNAIPDLDNIADNTKSTADNTKNTETELKWLKDIAEQEVINRFTTAEIKVDWNTNNVINKTTDVDSIMEEFETKLYEKLNSVADGVYT